VGEEGGGGGGGRRSEIVIQKGSFSNTKLERTIGKDNWKGHT